MPKVTSKRKEPTKFVLKIDLPEDVTYEEREAICRRDIITAHNKYKDLKYKSFKAIVTEKTMKKISINIFVKK